MAKDPAFLFYPGDYIAGTMHLDFVCKGAYIDLLMLQFNRGHMTLDMIHHMLGHNCGQLWGQIQDKFKIETINGTEFYFNERLRLEKQKRQLYVKSRVNNIDGTNQYKKKGKKTRGHMTSHMEDENEDKKLRSKIGDEIEDKRGEIQERGDCNFCQNWRNRNSSSPGVKVPGGTGKCIRPDGHCDPAIPRRKIGETLDYSQDFLNFWNAYPRKEDKKKTWERYQKVNADPDQIMAHTRRYAEQMKIDNQESRYIKLPATFLNATDFQSELPPVDIQSTLSKKEYKLQREYQKIATREGWDNE
uniref:Lin1244/Lin1753-like N-terminal domain-containing protein n=1 Tax=viral metagenome TaxID=1070528 RepID=A0A6M3M2M0_9ZZZZ